MYIYPKAQADEVRRLIFENNLENPVIFSRVDTLVMVHLVFRGERVNLKDSIRIIIHEVRDIIYGMNSDLKI